MPAFFAYFLFWQKKVGGVEKKNKCKEIINLARGEAPAVQPILRKSIPILPFRCDCPGSDTGVGFLEKTSALVTARISNGKKYALLAGAGPTFLGNLGLSYVLTDDPTAGSSTGSSYQTFSFTYAQEMNRVTRIPENMGHFSIGADVKVCKYQSSAGFDFDLASVFRPDEKLSLGLCLRNSSNVDTLLLGASYKLLDGKLLCAVENSELGVEWQAAKGMMVRAGKMGSTYTYGFGLVVKGIEIDYACLLSASSPVYYLSAALI